jgi:DNA-binding transcriptional MerR regulator
MAVSTRPAWYGVSGVARATGVTPESVRKWESAGRIPRAIRTDAGIRLWPADVVDEIVAAREAATSGRNVTAA